MRFSATYVSTNVPLSPSIKSPLFFLLANTDLTSIMLKEYCSFCIITSNRNNVGDF